MATGAALIVLLLMATSAGALLMYGRSSIERADIAGIAPVDRVPLVLPGGEEIEIMNVLLIGSDDRDTLSEDDRSSLNLEDRSVGRRPDTMMLAQLELNGSRAALLSFPRDLRVELCDGTVDKINASFVAGNRMGIGGESCLVQTISEHTGIEVHHYAEVDFRGFLEVIDVLGGVTMYLEKPMIDSKAHLNVPAGCVTLTPEQALGFVRSRGYDDDFGRIARQQRFIREVVQELTRVGVIANPAKLFSLVDAGANAVTTDQGFGLGVMREVASGARNMTAESLQAHTVPGDSQLINGVSYVVEREAEAAALYARFRDGTILRPEEEPTAVEADAEPVSVPPLSVLNGTDTAGLGALAADVLSAAGYEVAEVANAEVKGSAVTEVLHGAGLGPAAEQVAASLPGAVVRPDEGIEGIAVRLGGSTDVPSLQSRLDADPAEGAADQDGTTGAHVSSGSAPVADPAAGVQAPTEQPTAPTPPPAPVPTPERTFRGADPGDVDC